MTFSYTPGGGTDLDDIRSAIGDTDGQAKAAERLEDEEIARALTVEGTVARAKVASARALLAKLSRRATDRTMGGTRLAWSQRLDGLRAIIRDLEAALAATAAPFCGGISVADVEARDAATDRVAPDFASGMLDNPRGVDGF